MAYNFSDTKTKSIYCQWKKRISAVEINLIANRGEAIFKRTVLATRFEIA